MQTARRKRTQSKTSWWLILGFLVLLTFSTNVEAQNPPGISLRSGFLWAHTDRVAKYGNNPVLLIGLEIRDKENLRPWRKRYNLPDQGWSFNYAYLFDPDELGSAFFINRFIDLHFIRTENYFLDFRMAAGLAYNTRKYHPENLPDNWAIGSSINLSLRFELWNKFSFKSKNTLAAGIGISHFSNGSFASPNYGINIPGIALKYEFAKGEKGVAVKSKKFNRLRAPMISLGYSLKEKTTPGGEKFPVYTASLWMNWDPEKFSLLNSLDYVHNRTHEGIHPENLSGLKISQLGIYTGLALNMDRASLFSGIGLYLKNPGNIDPPYYFKAGGWYDLSQALHIGTALKWHYFRADYLELFVAYSLH